MLDFQTITPVDRTRFASYLKECDRRGCEYSFTNLCIWGRQKAAFLNGFAVLFSQFDRFSVYPFPVGSGERKPVLDAVIHDARMRGIPCRFSSMTAEDCGLLEQLYPGQFQFHTDRDDYDYVYAIEDLAALKGKRLQSKRNYVNRFRGAHPKAEFLPLDAATEEPMKQMLEDWYQDRLQQDPYADFHLEQQAIRRALVHMNALSLEGMVLMEEGKVLAMTMGSPLSDTTFDIHFEKALDRADGAYAAINQAFSRYLMNQYPQLQYLNREDDMGIPGLRKAKLSYHPHHMVEKYWARLWEDDDVR